MSTDIFTKMRFFIYAIGIVMIVFVVGMLVSKPKDIMEIKKVAAANIDRNSAQQLSQITLDLLQLNKEYKKASPEKKTQLFEQMVILANQRKQIISTLVDQNPRAVVDLALPKKIARQLPLAVQTNLEQEVQLDGTLQMIVQDDFLHKTAKREYKLHTTSQDHQLYFADDSSMVAAVGSPVRVKGIKLDNNIITTKDSVQALDYKTDSVLGATTIKKVAYILFNFNTNPLTPFTVDDMRRRGFLDGDSVNRFFQAVSYGKITQAGKYRTDGDVYGWYTLTDTVTGCPYQTWMNSAAAQATNAGVDLTGYDNIVYVFAGSSGCGWAGLAYVTLAQSMINTDVFSNIPAAQYLATSFAPIVEHEMGHNYGEDHSSSYQCVDANGNPVSMSSNCKLVEYADPYDVMTGGGSPITGHFNVFHKGRLGYITTSAPNTVDVSLANGSYTYDITPIETASNGIQSLRIPRDLDSAGVATSYYYLEFRQPLDIFDALNIPNRISASTTNIFKGVTMYFNPPYSTFQQSAIISAHPSVANSSNLNDLSYASLLKGESFIDPVKNITVSVINIASTSARVQVVKGTPPCTPIAPRVVINPASQYGQRGEQLTYSIEVTNQNSACPLTSFALNYSRPSSAWLNIPTGTTNLNISPGATVTIPITITSFTNSVAPVGTNTFKAIVAQVGYPGSYGTATGTYIIYDGTTDTVSPVASISDPLDGTVIAGQKKIYYGGGDYFGVTKVELYADNTLLNSSTFGFPFKDPFSTYYIWDTTKVAEGKHMLQAKTYDAAGNIGMSVPITVTVANNSQTDITPPTIVITSPQSGENLVGIYQASADATDNVGVLKVEYYIDNILINSLQTAPYNTNIDTTLFGSGTHTLVAKAYDTSANVATSDSVVFNLSNTSITPTPIVTVIPTPTTVVITPMPTVVPSSTPTVTLQPTATPTFIPTATLTPTFTPIPTQVPIDIIPPTVSIISPVGGSVVARSTMLSINAQATDNIAVKKVDFYFNNSLQCSDVAVPYSCNVKIPSKRNAVYTISAKAYDTSNNISTINIQITAR